MITRVGLGLVAVALMTGPLASQQHQHDATAAGTREAASGRCEGMSMMQGMMGMMGGEMQEGMGGMTAMMEAMRLSPANVLHHKDALGLTSDQVSRIEALSPPMAAHGMMDRASDAPAMRDMPMMAEMRKQHERLQAAFDASPVDQAGLRSALERMAGLHGRMMADRMTASAQVRDVLTAGQRRQLRDLPTPCAMHQDAEAEETSGQESMSEHEQHHPPPTHLQLGAGRGS